MSKRQSGLHQAFGALAYGDYRRFSLSLLFTSLGAHVVLTTVLWQVYELTNSAWLVGLTGVARAVPQIVLSLVGGVVADRLDRVRLFQAGQAANAILVLGLAFLTLTGSVEVWHLYLATFLNGAFSAVTQPARTALIPWLVPKEILVSAVALNATLLQSSQIIGPALAGLAIASFGSAAANLLNGLLYLLAMFTIVGIRAPATQIATSLSHWRSFLEGLAFVSSRPVILSLLAMDVALSVLGAYRGLLPALATTLGVGASGYGMLSAAPGVGSLIGAFLILSLGDMRYKGFFTVFGVLAYCLALVLLAVSPWFWLTLVAVALLGAMNSVQVVPRNAVILSISPDGLRGRVESFRNMLAGGGPPLGYSLMGAMAVLLGPPLALILGAAACAAITAGIGATRRELRDPDLGSTRKSPAFAGRAAGEKEN